MLIPHEDGSHSDTAKMTDIDAAALEAMAAFHDVMMANKVAYVARYLTPTNHVSGGSSYNHSSLSRKEACIALNDVLTAHLEDLYPGFSVVLIPTEQLGRLKDWIKDHGGEGVSDEDGDET